MPIQSFDDTAMANGPVPGRGSSGGSAPSSPPKGGSLPGKVVQQDGTANLRAATETKRAGTRESPAASAKNKWPAGVKSFTGGSV